MKPCVCGTEEAPHTVEPDSSSAGAAIFEVFCLECRREVCAPSEAEALRMWNAAMGKGESK